MAISLKNKLFDYFAQRHFDLMSPEVRARFDEYAKNGDFQGHMKHWNDNFVGAMTPDLVNVPAGGTNEHQLTPDEWEELYDAYQEAFQNMDVEKVPTVGFDNEYKKATKDFIAEWFGKFADGKVFIQKEATVFANGVLSAGANNLADFLDANPTFKDIFKRHLKETFSDISYGDFINGLRTSEYNSNTKFRDKVIAVVEYIRDYGPQDGYIAPDKSRWPVGVGYAPHPNGDGTFTATAISPLLNDIYTHPDIESWFEINPAQKPVCVQRFKDNYTKIFDTLLTKSKVREHFFAQTNNPIITEPLNEAIKQTDYANKDSKDYVPEKYPDEKTWVQRIQDWKDDTYENHFRRFTNPSRGARLFFSPWSQNIMKAFDKVKIKPTDGLEGILSKKSEILDKLKSSATATDYFKWFTDTLEKLKKSMPEAIEGALRNGGQMREVVSAIMAEAVENGKIKEAKTALEVLSVAKYGLSTSRTLDKLREDKELFNVFSNKDLSWNKNEGVKFVTNAIDKTVRAGVLGVGLAATGVRNLISRQRAKIGNDISKNKILNDAHKHWNEEDLQKTTTDKRDEATRNLADLAAGIGKSGTVIANAADLAAAEVALGGMAAGPARDNLEADIKLYKESIINQHNANQELIDIGNRQATRAAGDDPYQELVAYWHMLENVGKTHAFTLGSMAVKRKNMLERGASGKSKAEQISEQYLADWRSRFGALRTA